MKIERNIYVVILAAILISVLLVSGQSRVSVTDDTVTTEYLDACGGTNLTLRGDYVSIGQDAPESPGTYFQVNDVVGGEPFLTFNRNGTTCIGDIGSLYNGHWLEIGQNDFQFKNGNVGIGVTSPSYKLEVDGGVNLNNSFYVNESTGNIGISQSAPDSALDIDRDGMISPKGDWSVTLSYDGVDTFYETRSGDMSEGLLMQGNGVTDSGLIRQLWGDGYTNGWAIGLHLFNEGNYPIFFRTNDIDRMVIASNGNVTIDENLTVNHSITANHFIGDGSQLTNLSDIPITKLLFVDGNRVDSYTEDGSRLRPYKTIQSAINNASAGMIVGIEAGTYNENITLKAGVRVRSRVTSSYYGSVTINGKVTWLSGAGRVEIAGIYIINTNDHAVELLGTDAQLLDCYNCKFETNSVGAHHALVATNTNTNSKIFMRNSLVQVLDSSGGAKCIDTDATSALTIGMKDTTVRITDDTDNVAIDLDGAVNYWHTLDTIGGRVTVATGASSTISLCSMTSATQPVLTTNSAGITVMSNTLLTTTASPAVTGAGAFAYLGVSYVSTGQGLAATLNGGVGPTIGAIPFDSASNIIYDNAISGLSATLVKTAIDEVAASALWSGGWTNSSTETNTTLNVNILNSTGSSKFFVNSTSGNVYSTKIYPFGDESSYFELEPKTLSLYADWSNMLHLDGNANEVVFNPHPDLFDNDWIIQGNDTFIYDAVKYDQGENTWTLNKTNQFIVGGEGDNAELNLWADKGDDSQDKWKIKADGAGLHFEDVYGSKYFSLGYNTAVVVNEGGDIDVDFRVESNNDTHAFFVDAGCGDVGIGTDTPSAKLDVKVTSGGAATIGSSVCTATGDYAVAFGNSNASGSNSFATNNGQASGGGSFSVGSSYAFGSNSFAFGTATAYGDRSFAMGYGGTNASGGESFAGGYDAYARGTGSFAFGTFVETFGGSAFATGRSTAFGNCSFASGWSTNASGERSFVMGHHSVASGDSSFTGGKYMQPSSGYGTFVWGNSSSVQAFAPADNRFLIFPQGDTGRVGIGTTAPNAELHVVGNATVTNNCTIGNILHLTPIASAPSSPLEGDIYYNSVNHKAYCYNGTAWQGMW